jgi:hypothetical protein
VHDVSTEEIFANALPDTIVPITIANAAMVQIVMNLLFITEYIKIMII